MNTDIKNIIISSGDKAQYDDKAKKILGNKHILAQILCMTVSEFNGMEPAEVFHYIEGEPIINRVPVEPGMTNSAECEERIAGLNTEDFETNEGLVRYDIIFYVRMRDGLAKIIVNVEAQKDDPIEYNIIDRTVFYVCRMISSQKNREFDKQNFNDIKQVYSIWVCMDSKDNCMSHIHFTEDKMLGNPNWKGRIDLVNIVLIGIGNDIPEKGNKEYKMHRLLGTMFSDSLPVEDKIKVMEEEYDIPMEKHLKEDLVDMCNLSKGIEAKGEAKGIIQTYQEFGVSESEIIKKIQDKMNVTLAQAQEYFGMYGKKTV